MAHPNPYDVIFHTPDRSEGFILIPSSGQDRDLQGSFGPAELAAEVAKSRDVPIQWFDWSGGAGFSENYRGIFGINFTRNACHRQPRILTPSAFQYRIQVDPAVGTIDGPVVDSIYFNNKLVIATKNKVLTLAPDSLEIQHAQTIAADTGEWPGTTTDLRQFAIFAGSGGQKLYLTDRGGRLLVSTDGTTFSRIGGASPVSYNAANTHKWRFTWIGTVYWAVGDQAGFQLVGVNTIDPVPGGTLVDTYTWHVAGDPASQTAWSPVAHVGAGFPIKSIAMSNRRAYYVTEEGVYDQNEVGYSPNMTPYWKDTRSPNNGLWSTVFSGLVLASHQFGLDMIPVGQGVRIDSSTFVGLGVGLPNETPVYGPTITGKVIAGQIYIVQFNGVDSYISVARPRDQVGADGPGPLVWYTEHYFPNQKVTHINTTMRHINSRPMLMVFAHDYDDSGPYNMKYYELTLPRYGPTPFQDYINDGDFRFSEEYQAFFPGEDWGDTAASKNLMQFDIQADGLGLFNEGAATIEVRARNETEDWTSQGVADTSPRDTVYPPGEYMSGYRFFIEALGRGFEKKALAHLDGTALGVSENASMTILEADTAHPAGAGNHIYTFTESDVRVSRPPVLRALKARAGIVIEQRETRVFRLRMAPGELKDGTQDTREFTDLEEWVYSLQNYGPISADLEEGHTHTIKVEAGATWIESENPRSDKRVRVVELVVSLIERAPPPAISDNTVPWTGARWDDGSLWGTNVGSYDIEWGELEE